MTAERLPLPIDAHLPAMVEAARTGNVVLVAEPGAGKTTRVAPALLDAAVSKRILVVEPRRLAARAAAEHVAKERHGRVGGEIGYQVRFEDRTSRETKVCFATEGVVVRRLIEHTPLEDIGVLVLDEFHERHLQSDLLLALARRLQHTMRPDLRILVMSATMEASPVAAYLDARSVSVAGRTFPVEVSFARAPDSRPLETQVASTLRALSPDGDVLVFLPGAAEIRRAMSACEEIARTAGLERVVLHGDMPLEDQARAIRSSSQRKLILSTNVAETSVTIEGVTTVIDSGLARIAKHSPWSGLSRLEVAPISRASANQRAGRAGRTQPGRCFRLYTRHEFEVRREHEEPEIRRADLAELVLMLRARDLGDPRTFPFFEAPAATAINAAEHRLARLGALDDAARVTPRGRRLLSLPVHPRLGRLVDEAHRRGHREAGCLAAAVLSERELRVHARTRIGAPSDTDMASGDSDVLERMVAFERAEMQTGHARALREEGIDSAAFRAVGQVRDQLERATRAWPPQPQDKHEADAVRMAVLAAFGDRVGRRRRKNEPAIVFAAGGSGQLSPTSVVCDAEFIVCVDADERGGSSAHIRAASAIEPEWLLELFPDQISDDNEVRFDPEHEHVVATHVLRYDGLVLDETSGAEADQAEVSQALFGAARNAPVSRFCDEEALDRLRRRMAFAAGLDPAVTPLSDDLVQAALRDLCSRARGFADLARLDLLAAIRNALGTASCRRIDALAPETVPVGARRAAPVHYEFDRPPWLASRLQDFFGMRQSPRIGGGGVSVVLHLLAPNHRPIQVTTDLAGFWQNHYPAIRRELMRRYPRHAWPENPVKATPNDPVSATPPTRAR